MTIYIKHSILDPHGIQLPGEVVTRYDSLVEAEFWMDVAVKAFIEAGLKGDDEGEILIK